MIIHTKTCDQQQGEALGFHLGWSGNHKILSEKMETVIDHVNKLGMEFGFCLPLLMKMLVLETNLSRLNGQSFTGEAPMQLGNQLPRLAPQSSLIYYLKRED